jgi:signal transduction histidine kinase
MTLLAVTYLEMWTPPTITISALALIPTLVAASLLPDAHVVAVLLTAVTCQGSLVLTGDLMPITAGADTAATLVTAGMGRLAAGGAARIWAERALLLAVDEITEVALAGRPPVDVLRTVALAAMKLLRADAASIVVEEEGRDLLTVAAAAGLGASRFEGLTFSRAGSVSGRVMDGAGTTLVPRLGVAAATEPFLDGHLAGWALFVPLPRESRCGGALVVTGRPGSKTVRPSLQSILESLAARASFVCMHAAGQEDRRRLAVLEDRARIAREVHDGVIQSLLAVGAIIQLVRSSGAVGPDSAERLHRCAKTLDESVDDLRRYVLGLQTPRAEWSLADALKDMVEQLQERTGIDARIEAEPDALAAARSAAPDVIQMVHECLSNVERHARATRCWVRVYWADASLVIEVADDGQGLDSAERIVGLGLENIRWRANRLGGVTQIQGARGRGTTLRVALPISHAQAV